MVFRAQAIKIYTAGNGFTAIICAVPDQAVSAGTGHTVEERLHKLAFDIIDIQFGCARCSHIEADSGFRVEGVGIVLI